jgi:hypothetical protein
LGALSCTTPSHSWHRRKHTMLLVTALVLSNSAPLRAQSSVSPASTDTTQQNLPDVASGSTSTDSGMKPGADLSGQTSQSGSHSGSRSGGSNLFGLPRSFTETTSSGIKFQLALPRLSFAGVDHGMGSQGFGSPLDSGGMKSTGGSDLSLFPSGGSSMRSTGAAFGGTSGNPFTSASRNNQASAGGVGVIVPLKTSIFDVHLSMKDMLGGSFSQGTGGAGAGSFGLAGDSGAGNFGGAGGLRAPGAGGRGSSGAKMSLQLKF